jgi:hypothetical protein
VQIQRPTAIFGPLSLAEQLVQHAIEHIRLRHLNEIAVILFNLRKIRNKINLMRPDKLRSLQELPSQEENWEEEDLD